MSERIWGIHPVTEALKQRPQSVANLCLQKGVSNKRVQVVQRLAERAGVPVDYLDKREMDRECNGVHQGVLARLGAASTSANIIDEKALLASLEQPARSPFILILDGVTDPHNLGACLRSADAAGVTAVVFPKDKAVQVNPTVRKVACGAAETVTIVPVTNLSRCLKSLQDAGVWLVGTSDQAEKTLYEQDLTGPIGLIMGSEGDGMRRLTRESCDYLVSIPMAGSLSSLNVSVATGIVLFEAVRQRRA